MDNFDVRVDFQRITYRLSTLVRFLYFNRNESVVKNEIRSLSITF